MVYFPQKGVGAMNISLGAIRYFVTAAKYENFSKAANELYTAQPNLSKRIAELERATGVRLFQRIGKQVRLTEAGRLLQQEWAEALDKFDQSLAAARAMQLEQDNVLSLGVLEGVDISAFVPRMQAFQSEHPNVILRLERCGMHRLWQEFDAGGLDMIVTSEASGTAPVTPPSVARYVAGTNRGMIAINVSDPMARHATVTLSMLREESFIALAQEATPQGYLALQEACRRAGFEPRIIRETASIETMLLYVEAGIGISLVSGNSRFISDPNIRLVPVDDLYFDDVVYWRTNPLHPAVQAVVGSFLGPTAV